MKPYKNYKPSGEPWLGDVPNHWRVERLRFSICAMESGKSVNAADVPALPHQIGVLKTSCVYTRSFRHEENKTVVSDEVNLVACPVRLNSLIVSRMNTPELVGAAGLVREAPDNIFLPDRLWQVTFDNAVILTGYIYWFTLTQAYSDQVRVASSGSSESMQNLGQDKFRNIVCVVPPLSEQKSIAGYLEIETTRIDELIREKEGLLSLLAEYRLSEIDANIFRGLDPNVRMQNSGIPWLGIIPSHWRIERARFAVKVNPKASRYIEDTEVVSFLPMEAIGDDGVLQLDQVRTVSDVSSGYTFFENGDVTIAKITPCFENGKGAHMRDLVGKVGYGTTELIVIRPSDNVSPDWLYFVTQTHLFRKRGEAMMQGAGGQKRVPDSFVKDFPLAIPPLHEQTAIAFVIKESLKRIDDLIAHAREELHFLNELRAATVTDAVLGRIDVSSHSAKAQLAA